MIEFTEMLSPDSEPQEYDLNSLGRGRFLCRVAHQGTMIEAARLEFVVYTKERGFNVLPFSKEGLTCRVTDWAASPDMPSKAID